METVKLGRTGLDASVAGLGCGGHSRLGMFTKGIDYACDIIRDAYDNGVNFFDTALIYGTQPAVGRALKEVPRESYILSTKFPYSRDGELLPADALERNADICLKELQTDTIDVFHLHAVRPEHYQEARDRFYPELVKLRDKGKIRFIGLTELFGGDTTHEMLRLSLSDDIWDVMMVGYNIINPSAAKSILPGTKEKNIGTLCMFAVRSALSNPDILRADVKKMIAAGQVDTTAVKEEKTLDFLVGEGHADTVMEAAYRFCRYASGIDVTLIGTSSREHLNENLRSITKPPLPLPVLQRLEGMFGKVDCVSGQQDFPK